MSEKHTSPHKTTLVANKIKQEQNNLTKSDQFLSTLFPLPYLRRRICEGGHWLSRISNKSCRRNIHLCSADWGRDAVVAQVVLLIKIYERLALGITHYLIWNSERKCLVITSLLELLPFWKNNVPTCNLLLP